MYQDVNQNSAIIYVKEKGLIVSNAKKKKYILFFFSVI